MQAVKLLSLACFAPLLGGCGALYEDVPVYGQSDPSRYVVEQQSPATRGTVAAIGVPADNQSQTAVDPGQPVQQDEYADTDPSALTDFKQTLDPYGTWADDPQYGTVWQPDPGVVGNDFAPYVTGGHWAYDDDYVWVSDYDWGWAPFHYGRWAWMSGRWGWIPGRRYAGAWVGWRTGPAGYGYVGWGPMAPSWGWRGGVAYNYGFGTSTPYSFCETRNLFAPSLNGRVIGGAAVNTVANGTTPWTGRTLAHPGVGGTNTGGPPPSHFGLAPPPFERSTPGMVGINKAMSFSRPTTAVGTYGAHAPAFTGAATRAQQVPYPPQGNVGGWNHAVATAPRYNGIAPRPYARMYQAPYRGGYSGYGGGYGGNYQGGYSRPYSAPYRSGPTYYNHGSSGGGFHVPSSPSYGSSSHSYSHSYSHGGGGGHGHR
jgi:hypothetical protein